MNINCCAKVLFLQYYSSVIDGIFGNYQLHPHYKQLLMQCLLWHAVSRVTQLIRTLVLHIW